MSKIYLVTVTSPQQVQAHHRLVEAPNRAAALAFAARRHIAVDLATPAQLIAYTKAGVDVESAVAVASSEAETGENAGASA